MNLFQVAAIIYSNNGNLISLCKSSLYRGGFTHVYVTNRSAELNDYVQSEPEVFVIYDAVDGYPKASEINLLLCQRYGVLGLLFFSGGTTPYTTPKNMLPNFPIKSVQYPLEQPDLQQALFSMLQTGNISSFVVKHKIDVLVAHFLNEIGIPSHLCGYHYLHTAITVILSCPEQLRNLSQNVYPHIAQKNHTTVACIERAMRHALQYAKETSDSPILWSDKSSNRPRTIVNFLAASTSLIREGNIHLTKEELYGDLQDFPIESEISAANEGFWERFKV